VRKTIPKLGDQRRHLLVVGFVLRGIGAEAGLDGLHYRSFESFGSFGSFEPFPLFESFESFERPNATNVPNVTNAPNATNGPNAPNVPNDWLPPTTIGLEAALRATPDGVHPVHFGLAAPLADLPVVGVAGPLWVGWLVFFAREPHVLARSAVRFSHALHYRATVFGNLPA
jgi:hypothetical protein